MGLFSQYLQPYFIILVSKLLGDPRLAGRLPQPVLNTSLPSTCSSPDVNQYLVGIPRDGWRRAMDEAGARGQQAGPRVYDVSKGLDADTVKFDSATGLGRSFRTLEGSQQAGDFYTGSELMMSAHSGTHIDAPGHFIWRAYASGVGVESLDLSLLMGPSLLVDVSGVGTNITAGVLASLKVPSGVQRLLFKTANTVKGLMHHKRFDSSYIGLTKDGARYIVERLPHVRTVGTDYLSVAAYDDLIPAHVKMLGHGLVLVEGLVLDDVTPGLYHMTCLPLKVVGADGAPARCILVG